MSKATIFWTIFKLSRLPNGKYEHDLNIDKKWVERQGTKIQSSAAPVLYIIADTFAEIVYECELTSEEKKPYLASLKNVLGKYPNFSSIEYESKLINSYWDYKQYSETYESLMANPPWTAQIIKAETLRRKAVYNPQGYLITKNESEKAAQKALALFRVEKVLVDRFIPCCCIRFLCARH